MICIKCNSEIPDGSKFCPHCGQKAAQPSAPHCASCGLELEPNAKFCSVCGAPVQSNNTGVTAAPTSGTMGYAGVVDGASGGEMQTISASNNMQSDSLVEAMHSAAAAAEAGIPSMNTASAVGASAPVNSVPTPVNDIPTPVNGVPTPSNSGYGSGFSAGISGTSPTSSVNLAKNTAPNDFGFDTAAAVAVAPVKKSKAKVGIIIGAAAIVVVAALALIFLFNKGPVMNLLMGNSRYASMIEGNGLKNTMQLMDDPAVSAGIKSASSTFAAAASSELADNDTYDEFADDDFDFSASTSMTYEPDISSVIRSLNSSLMEAYGSNSVSVTTDIDISLTDTAKALIYGDSDTAELDELIAAINDLTFGCTLTADEDIASAVIELSDSKLTVNTEAIILSDGTVYISFPFGSDKALKYVVDQGEVVSVEEAPVLDIDEKEISRLLEEILDVYLKYYENADITIDSEGEITAAGAAANGKLITAELNSEMIQSMFASVADVIANDSYFCDKIVTYANECGADITAEDYKEAVLDFFNEGNYDSDGKLIVKTIVDKNNNVLAKSYSAVADEETVSIAYIDGEENAAFEICSDGTEILAANITKTSENSGSINAKFSDGESYPFAIKVEYSNVNKVSFRGNDVYTGSYTFSFTPPADFTSGVSGDEAMVYAALGASTITISTDVNGDAISEAISIDVPQYGSLALKVNTAFPETGAVAVPSNAIDLTDLLNSDPYSGYTDEDMAKFKELAELFGELKAKTESSDSYFAEYLTDFFGMVSDELESASEPKASSSDISDLSDRIYDAISTAEDFKYNYSDIWTNDLSNSVEDLTDKLYDLTDELYDNYFDMSLAKLESLEKELSAIESEIIALEKELEAAAEAAAAAKPTVTTDYSDMSYDELLDVLIDLEDRFFDIDVYYYEQIQQDDELYDMYEDCYDCYEEVYDDFIALNDSMSGGTYSVALLRELRKSAQAFSDAVIALENAVSDYAA